MTFICFFKAGYPLPKLKCFWAQSLFIMIVALHPNRVAFAEVLEDSDGVGMHWVHIDNFATREEAFAQCAIFDSIYRAPGDPGGCLLMGVFGSPALMAFAGWYQRGHTGVFDVANYYINKCGEDSTYNVATGRCGLDEQKGSPPLESCVGNPINIAIGNKFQQETDYLPQVADRPSFSRTYNSLDGLWRHNYSTSIRFALGKLSLVHADGRESFFTVDGDVATAYPNETGTLVKKGSSWLYTAVDNQRLTFDTNGRLLEILTSTGRKLTLSYTSRGITVAGDTGSTLTFEEDAQHQPISLVASGLRIDYGYNPTGHLTKLNRSRNGQTEQRLFHYEDGRNASLLTGITDERGVRFATWAYDDQGRAISSQHSGGAGLTQVAYNVDGSSTVTNELGKNTVYRYQQIGGVKRVTSIEGEPSANCPESNSTYTYNERGQVLTKTDAKGLVTAFMYDDRGLETSRTEASGTPSARTIITEWDATRFLPVRIIEADRITIYRYDPQGRKVSRQTNSHRSNKPY
jgi:hypothetical protein